MNRKELMIKIKEEQKLLAVKIRALKSSRKQGNRKGRPLYQIEADVDTNKYKYRHVHIAYCEMRGRTRDEIEKPRIDNPASQSRIDKYKKEWMEQIDEDVCAVAA